MKVCVHVSCAVCACEFVEWRPPAMLACVTKLVQKRWLAAYTYIKWASRRVGG